MVGIDRNPNYPPSYPQSGFTRPYQRTTLVNSLRRRGSDLYLFEVLQNAVRRLVCTLTCSRGTFRKGGPETFTNEIQVDDGALQVLAAESFQCHFIMIYLGRA